MVNEYRPSGISLVEPADEEGHDGFSDPALNEVVPMKEPLLGERRAMGAFPPGCAKFAHDFVGQIAGTSWERWHGGTVPRTSLPTPQEGAGE